MTAFSDVLTPLAFFERQAGRYDARFAPSAASTDLNLRALLERAPRGGVALDLGSGTGRAWPSLLAAGLSVVAIDASRAMHAQAAKRASAASVLGIVADLYDPEGWPIDDASCDVVLALHAVFAHPPEATSGAPWGPRFSAIGREIKRVARPGALVAIDLPEPSWARGSLVHVDGDRFAHVDDDGAAVYALVPPPREIVAALGLPLTLTAAETGTRAVGRLGAATGQSATS